MFCKQQFVEYEYHGVRKTLNTQCATVAKLNILCLIMGCIMNDKVRYEMNVRVNVKQFNHYGMVFWCGIPWVMYEVLMPIRLGVLSQLKMTLLKITMTK